MSPGQPVILMVLPDARLRDIYVSRFEREAWIAESAHTLLDAERRAVQLRPTVLLVHATCFEDIPHTFAHLRSLPTLLKTAIVVADTRLARASVDAFLASGAHEVVSLAHLTPLALVKRMNNFRADV